MTRVANTRDQETATNFQARDSGGSPDRSAVVLVGLDGSRTSWDAFYWACGEARRLRGRAVAVFVSSIDSGFGCAAWVLGVPICGYPSFMQVDADLAAELEAEARNSAASADIDLTFLHVRGDTATEILRVAAAIQADLIIVGRSTKFRRHLTGALGRRLIGRRITPTVVVVA